MDRDNGNFANDTWRFMEEDNSTDELLDRYPFSPSLPRLQDGDDPFIPLGVAGHPKNCIHPEEYVCMFLGELLQVIVVDTNHYARAKIAARESDKIHRTWVDVTL